MAQGAGKKKANKGKSVGATRKLVGKTRKNFRQKKQDFPSKVHSTASSTFVQAIETAMAQRLPSDQRGKLTVVKNTGQSIKNRKLSSKQKPLTRGRKRREK